MVAIGARYNGDDRGHVKVLQFNGTDWNPLGDAIEGDAADDQSGYSVAMSADGSIVAIGAPYNDGINGDDSSGLRD